MSYSTAFSRLPLLGLLLFLFTNCTYAQSQQENTAAKEVYTCLPCGYDCDTITYKQPGTCSHCQMSLVKQSTIRHKSLAPSAICSYINAHPHTILLDVRTKEEFEGKATPDYGTLQNAINIPVQELEGRLQSIAHLKDKEIIVVCSRSHRSPRASYLLTSNGFTNVINMEGGMSAVTDKTCKK